MFQIDKGIYGLPQAGKLAQDRLFKHLAQHGYNECPHTPCLLIHETRPVACSLVVDDFGIKYKGKDNANHLLDTLKKLYRITEDWTGTKYVGLTIDYNRTARTITLEMPGYVSKALKRLQVTKMKNDTNTPLPTAAALFKYGQKGPQKADQHDTSPKLSPELKTYIQQVVGIFLFYARAVDNTMLLALSRIGSSQANPTEHTLALVDHFLQYAATWPEAQIVYKPSKMKLILWSDGSHLSETNCRSRHGACADLSDDTWEPNGLVDAGSTIIPTVCGSTPETEYAAMYLTAKNAEPLRNTLAALGYPQERTPIITDNTIALGIATKTVKQNKSKAIDMRYHWLRDRSQRDHYHIIYEKGENNRADYFTKVHPAKHYTSIRNQYVQTPPHVHAQHGTAASAQRRITYKLKRQANNQVIPTHNRFASLSSID